MCRLLLPHRHQRPRCRLRASGPSSRRPSDKSRRSAQCWLRESRYNKSCRWRKLEAYALKFIADGQGKSPSPRGGISPKATIARYRPIHQQLSPLLQLAVAEQHLFMLGDEPMKRNILLATLLMLVAALAASAQQSSIPSGTEITV